MKHYLIAWDMGSGVVSAHLSIYSIAWLMGTRRIRHCRVWHVGDEIFPVELTPLINRQTHQVGLMDPHGCMVDMASYPFASP